MTTARAVSAQTAAQPGRSASPGLLAAVAAVAALAAVALLVSACTASKRATPPPSAAGSSSVSIPVGPAPTPPTTVPTYTQYPVPASVSNDPAKHGQVQLTSCTTTPSGASAAGTVHNTTAHSTHYAITVFFTSNTATAVDYATATVTAGAGSTVNFSAQQAFAAPDKVLCVLAGVS